jgi:FkbM family methyltransferase
MLAENVYRAYLRAPNHPAKLRVEKWLAQMLLPEQGGVFAVGDDVRLRLHPRDWIEYVLIRDSSYEPLTLEFLKRNLRSGGTAMLAGTNFGLHVVVASRAVGSSGFVVGVDPQLNALSRTRASLALNGSYPNVRLVAAALGSSGDLLVIDDPPDANAGTANLRQPGRGPMCAVTMRAGEVWRALSSSTPSPDLMLLDVEGFEGHVLAGFDERFRPKTLIVEIWEPFLREVGSSKAQLCSRLRELGYRLSTIDGHPASAETELPEHNIVAVQP